ncbi:MAG: hypothetical protein B7733_13135 [Myxococcales bacterium FL481]|nr:MAG: hypothetical protein B7733_13135 [Myxococcales bacterium FL481]
MAQGDVVVSPEGDLYTHPGTGDLVVEGENGAPCCCGGGGAVCGCVNNTCSPRLGVRNTSPNVVSTLGVINITRAEFFRSTSGEFWQLPGARQVSIGGFLSGDSLCRIYSAGNSSQLPLAGPNNERLAIQWTANLALCANLPLATVICTAGCGGYSPCRGLGQPPPSTGVVAGILRFRMLTSSPASNGATAIWSVSSILTGQSGGIMQIGNGSADNIIGGGSSSLTGTVGSPMRYQLSFTARENGRCNDPSNGDYGLIEGNVDYTVDTGGNVAFCPEAVATPSLADPAALATIRRQTQPCEGCGG